MVLWSCGQGPVVRAYSGFERQFYRSFAESSWSWEVIDTAYSQMAPGGREGPQNARTHIPLYIPLKGPNYCACGPS